MIDPKAITTYAQYNEDIVLLALLHDVRNGFYVDVGANDPVVDSITKIFYDRGWHGINIEPLKDLYEKLIKARTRDINLQIGISDKPGQATFHENKSSSGQSTFAIQQKNNEQDYLDYTVKVRPLKDILKENKVAHINFLKVDVEGFEYNVLAGNDWKQFRPDIICIEANHIIRDWRPILINNGYKLFISDGLNEYYICEKSWHRTEGFPERVVKLDYHALKQHQQQSWHTDSKVLQKQHTIIAAQAAEIERLQNELVTGAELSDDLKTLTLKEQPLGARLKRAGHGLTVDWVRYKRQHNK